MFEYQFELALEYLSGKVSPCWRALKLEKGMRLQIVSA
jgi:hypothetical protein